MPDYIHWIVAVGVVSLLISMSDVALSRVVVNDTGGSHKADFEAMMSRCEEELPSFHDLMEILRRTNKTITVVPGRGQAGVWVDSFNTNEVDLDDLEDLPNPTRDPDTGKWKFPDGVNPQASTRCQFIAHFLWERFFTQFVGGRYDPAHTSANDFEERIRRDYGQTGGPIDHTGQDGDDTTTVYRNGETHVEVIPGTGSDISGPPNVTPVKAICVGKCTGSHFRAQFGAANCEACQAQANAFCTSMGHTLGPFMCRTTR